MGKQAVRRTGMKEPSSYTLYHPKWYRTRVSTYWWTKQWSHFRFILRELTSLGVAYIVILILWFVYALNEGVVALAHFEEWLRSPIGLILSTIALFLVIFHAITWFNLAPRAMPVRLRGKRLPDWAVAAPNYVAWLGISLLIAYLLLGRT